MQTHKVKQFNWLYHVIQEKWCPGEVGLRYYDAPLTNWTTVFCQFMWCIVSVNMHECFTVCFTVGVHWNV